MSWKEAGDKGVKSCRQVVKFRGGVKKSNDQATEEAMYERTAEKILAKSTCHHEKKEGMISRRSSEDEDMQQRRVEGQPRPGTGESNEKAGSPIFLRSVN